MQIVLATNNQDKIKEIRQLLDDLPVTILTRDDFLDFPDIAETGTTLEENAVLKASGIAQFCDLPALADDSGLEVDALNGAPGIYSSRYAGDNVTYADNNRKLMKELEGVPKERRTARFRCVIAIDWNGVGIDVDKNLPQAVGHPSHQVPELPRQEERPSDAEHMRADEANIDIVEGGVEGFIADDTAEGHGFGYDPVFFHPPSRKRFSEMTLEEKNLVSHRGLALLKARDVIIKKLNAMKAGR